MLSPQLPKTSSATTSSICEALERHIMPPRQPPACEQCRHKQKKCDRQRPCEKCKKTPHLCLYPGDPGYTGNLKKPNKLKVDQDKSLHPTGPGYQGAVPSQNQSEPRSEAQVGGIGNAKWSEQDVSVLPGSLSRSHMRSLCLDPVVVLRRVEKC